MDDASLASDDDDGDTVATCVAAVTVAGVADAVATFGGAADDGVLRGAAAVDDEPVVRASITAVVATVAVNA